MSKKIHSELLITIIDENGSKQFKITKFIWKVAIYASILFLIIGLAEYFIMNSIIYNLYDINHSKKQALIKQREMHSKNIALRTDVENKTKQLQMVNDKIKSLEQVVHASSSRATKISHVDTSDISNVQKDIILKIIPNGEPIKNYMSKKKSQRNLKIGDMSSNIGISGFDFFTKEKESIYATADGVVEFTSTNHRSRYGNLVRISHALGFSSGYAHLSSVNVKIGQFVKKGDLIGYTSPSTTNIGLYYEVRFLSIELDTQSFLNWSSDNFASTFDSNENSVVDFGNLVWTIDDIAKMKELNDSYQNTGETQ